MKYDFIIVGLPRSGTHMLATALNSHPGILCATEDDKPLYGDELKGRVWTGLQDIPAAPRHIFLSRPAREREKSLRTTGFSHYHTRIPREACQGQDVIRVLDQDALLWKVAGDYHSLLVTYQDLTGGLDAEEINPTWAKYICDFLGVRVAPLRPATRKPIG